MVTNFNGTPAAVYPDPYYYFTYASYATQKGVVAVIEDALPNSKPDPDERVLEMLFVAPYKGKTLEGIGIGSTYHDVVAAYGAPETFVLDTAGTDHYVIDYSHRGMILVGRLSDTTIVQMEVSGYFGAAARRPAHERLTEDVETEILAHPQAR